MRISKLQQILVALLAGNVWGLSILFLCLVWTLAAGAALLATLKPRWFGKQRPRVPKTVFTPPEVRA